MNKFISDAKFKKLKFDGKVSVLAFRTRAFVLLINLFV